MAEMIRQELTAGSEIPSELLTQIRAAAKRPVNFTEDCPQLTDEQLAEFRPVNFATMEERYQAMLAAGVIDEEALEDDYDDIEEDEPAAVIAGK